MTPDPLRFRCAFPPPEMDYQPPTAALNIIFADEHLVVVEKPEGLLTVRAKFAGHEDCLETRLRQEFPTARVVHRLDMDTSGLIVLPLTDQAQRHLGRQFEQKRVQKTYQALVQGLVEGDVGEVDLALTSDKENLPKQKVCIETGRPSKTNWKVLSRMEKATRLELTPLTGRSHQLRVHLMACGHTIVGDRFYGEAGSDSARLMLHACWLKFRHPATNQFIEFNSACPF